MIGLVAVPSGVTVSDAVRVYVASALTLMRSPATMLANASVSVHGLPTEPSPPPAAPLVTYRSVIAIYSVASINAAAAARRPAKILSIDAVGGSTGGSIGGGSTGGSTGGGSPAVANPARM